MKRIQRRSALWLSAAITSLIFQAAAFASDLLLIHGHIYTGSLGTPWAQALSLTGTRIEAVGNDREILAHRGAHTRIIDLRGQTVIPGIVDAHVHFLFGAMQLHGFNLSTPAGSITPASPELFVSTIKAHAASHPNDAVLLGRADFSSSPPYAPNHELLDRAVSDRPVVVHNVFEHSVWLNAKALALAGITNRPVADPSEERNIVRDASGNPTGILIESAMQLAERAVQKQLSPEDQLTMLRDASRYLNQYGITSVVNATGDLAEIRLYATLRDRGQLTVRTRNAFGSVAVPHRLTPEFLADLEEARTRYHDEWVSANLVKFFADGSTGLIPPLVYEPEEFKRLVVELDRRGYQLMTHAERDDSVHMVLDAYAEATRVNGPRDRRLRIEHATVVYAADIPRFARESVIASMQPIFCCSNTGTNYDPTAGVSDRWHSFMGSGAVVALGTDWPCASPPNPFVNIQEAVTREIWHSDDTADIMNQPFDGAGQAGGRPTGKFYHPEERITVQQAVDAYTRQAAYAGFLDDRVGTLEPGKEADLAVLSQDIFNVPGDEIGKTSVVMTLVGGRIVYSQGL
jgi:predicted amidohydrolase YtcJ